MTPEQLMRVALDAARRGLAAGQTPFGCAIARGGRVIAACHNTVWLTTDATAHAEINAIREACRRSQQVWLEDTIVASTCEPCPMCAAALNWARVGHIYYGAAIADAAAVGFNELIWPSADVLSKGKRPIPLEGGCLVDDCRALFTQWVQSSEHRAY